MTKFLINGGENTNCRHCNGGNNKKQGSNTCIVYIEIITGVKEKKVDDGNSKKRNV